MVNLITSVFITGCVFAVLHAFHVEMELYGWAGIGGLIGLFNPIGK